MARLAALADPTALSARAEALRALVVIGCALALILAKSALPF